VENLGGRMRRMKKRGPNVLYDLNDLLFFLTQCPSEHKPMKNFGEKGAWAHPGTAQMF